MNLLDIGIGLFRQRIHLVGVVSSFSTHHDRICTGADNAELKVAATGLVELTGRCGIIMHGHIVRIERKYGTFIAGQFVRASVSPTFGRFYLLMKDSGFAGARFIKLNGVDASCTNSILVLCVISHVPAVLRLRDHFLNIVQEFLHARR